MKSNAAKGKPLAHKAETEERESHQPVAVADEDDPCVRKEKVVEEDTRKYQGTPGVDPRFQQQNQTLRCYVMYTDFYRCEKILGEGHEACTWFKDVFKSVCPSEWVTRWDEVREEGRFLWPGTSPVGPAPDDRYGV